MATGRHDRTPNRSQTSAKLKKASQLSTVSPTAPLTRRDRLKGHWPRTFSWSAIVVLFLAGSGLAGAGWLGIQLMVNPQTLLWMNRLLPNWIPIPVTGLKPPQTLDEVRNELTQAGRSLGEPLPLGKNISALDHKTTVSDILLPVLAQRANCQSDCEQIVELRVYQTIPTRQREQRLQLLDQLAIVGPDESFVLAPLINAGDTHQGSTRSLPLMMLNRFEGKVPAQGVWLNLSGRWLRGDNTIAYGQVLHYNSSRMHLHPMLEWSSPVGQDPLWQNVTGDSVPELIVDQTIGMEPQFQIYQVKPRKFLASPLQLEPILLLETAIDDGTYSNGLLLARSGLWSTGLQWLQSVQQRDRKGQWPAAAQAQKVLIQLHAQATQRQADKAWASPSQQVLANLSDGRWGRALTVFTANTENSLETATLLKSDAGRLQNRVDAALRVSPLQTDVRTWGALLVAAQQGRKAAIVWLKKQPRTTSTEIARVTALITRLTAPSVDETALATLPPGQLVGTAEALTAINAATWLKPKQHPVLKLGEQQAWYRVQLAGFQDGKSWRFSGASLGLPTNASADRLWQQLGLTADPSLSIVLWQSDGQQQTVSASIKAVRINAGKLELLAAGEVVPRAIAQTDNTLRPLAFTESALHWQTPETTQLSDWLEQQPEWAAYALPTLIQELKHIGKLPFGRALTWNELESSGIGSSPVQLATLTGNNQPDVIVTIDLEPQHGQTTPKAAKRLANRSRTLLFSATGTLLYSECSTESGLTYLAIANLGNEGGSAIVASSSENYRFLRWSAKRKRFE
ncbi:hypothetical protein [Stenomitos frigidus]|uniref:Uncharacterized protein n=2 Tax=Stenomitos TaxID=1844270 RepID=A0A2T1E5L8_9CYAN|nr:hypothetical protein [Stenomitos frigidus]PSB28026.1 hypothetical protein C7B82_14310 [Stenomitos frigidus ULC18]